MTTRKIPPNIEFSSKILQFPALRDLEIDKKISIRMQIETKFEIGDWVNRNDELAVVTVRLYKRNEKPRFSLKRDETEGWTFSFKSPVSGLVIGYKKEKLVEKPWGYSLFGSKYTFPILLIPEYEPPLTDYNSATYSRLWLTLKKEWPRMYTWDQAKGNVRMAEVFANNKISNAANPPKFDMQLEEYSDVVDKILSDEFYTETIEHLRANDLVLRDKLLHLVKNNYNG